MKYETWIILKYKFIIIPQDLNEERYGVRVHIDGDYFWLKPKVSFEKPACCRYAILKYMEAL